MSFIFELKEMKNFKQLKIWQKGFDIAIKRFELVKKFPSEEKYGLSLQITRAALSIPSNIAEGSSRQSQKDYCRYLEISLGSCFELETHLLLAQDINYRDKSLKEQLIQWIDEEQKMIMAFVSRLKS